MSAEYVIIGGGIVGSSIAYHLSKKTDEPIMLFERQSPASETTYKSIAQYGFYGDTTQYRMKRYGMQVYNKLFRNQRANPRYHSMGLLSVATEQENSFSLKSEINQNDKSSSDIAAQGANRDLVEYIPGGELEETLLLPPIDTTRIEGAIFRPKVGYMSRPHELAYEFLERAKENGVTVRSGTKVSEICTTKNRVTSIVTQEGESVDVGEVICAAGPWNINIAESVGVELPVKHTIAPVLKLRPQKPIEYDLPIIDHYESSYSFHRRTEQELLIGYNPGYESATRFSPSDVDETVPKEIRTEGIELLSKLVPEWMDADLIDEWVGIRSQTPDRNPIIGFTDLDGFSIAAFHTSGIQLAPAAGKIIARQLVDGDRTDYYDKLSITRFEGYDDHIKQ